MRTSHVIRTMVVATAAMTTAAGAQCRDPYASTSRYGGYLCQAPANGFTVPDDCCTTHPPANFSCNAGNATSHRNILLVVADDHDYCLYGFMAGLCSKDTTVSCTSEADCASAKGRCVGSADLHACSGNDQQTCFNDWDCSVSGWGTCTATIPASVADDIPLRLNDLACRNRQAQRKPGGTAFCGTGDRQDLDLEPDLTFNRGEAPCSGTPTGLALRTPHLDALARQAAVFPRAYVAGTTCKNSRRTMLHGRYMRHLQWLFDEGKGALECSRKGLSDAEPGLRKPLPKGCKKRGEKDTCGEDDSDNNSDRTCEDTHSIAWWVQHGAGAPTGTGESGPDGAYQAFGFAKLEVLAEGQGGFNGTYSKTGKGIGKVRCSDVQGTAQEACERVLSEPAATDAFPTAVMFDQPQRSLCKITEAIDYTIDDTTHAQKQPFFIWFGPHIPHEHPKAENFLNELYPSAINDREWFHYGRVTWLDADIGALVYHLKRACVCDGTTAQSLWSNTVVLFLADQGWLLPGAKDNAFEQTQRTPLIVSTPEHRSGATPGHVFDRDLADAIDLMPTILAYAGVEYFAGTHHRDDYRHGRNLKPLISNQAWPTDGSVKRRTLRFGELGRPNVKGMNHTRPEGGYPRYLVNRPGLFGVCEKPYNFTKTNPDMACATGDRCHVHPCLSEDDCTWSGVDLGTCMCPPASEGTPCTGTSPSAWQRCVNRPDVRCSSDEDCAAAVTGRYDDLCQSNTCADVPDQGSFKDFVAKACVASSPNRCMPPGTCRPLVLKMHANNSAGFDAVWDLDSAPDWDPEFQPQAGVNLLEQGSFFKDIPSPASLAHKAMNCVRVLKNLNNADDVWHDDVAQLEGCPDDIAGWR